MSRALLLVAVMLATAAGPRRQAFAEGGAPATRVLAYGDSLTAGFWNGGRRFHPYAWRLSALMGGCVVDHIGLSGWTAEQMRASLGAGVNGTDSVGRSWIPLDVAIAQAAAAGAPYTHVAILAGTNDLARLGAVGGRTADGVLADLRALHDAAHRGGVPMTLCLTVPQPAFEADVPPAAAGRAAINDGLRAFAAAANSSYAVKLVDVDAALPNLNAPADARKHRWEEDGLHFTPHGSGELGALLAFALRSSGAASCSRMLQGAHAGRALDTSGDGVGAPPGARRLDL